MRAHRFRLRYEDLEDCYSQATLELIRHVRDGGRFVSRRHLENVLEKRFVSRVYDRRRALCGRSAMQAALESAVPLGGSPGEEQLEIVDVRAEVPELVFIRHELRLLHKLACSLSDDQRLVLTAQLHETSCADFCVRHGWSPDKYRKVAQRGRAKLRRLLQLDEASERQATSSGGRAA